MFILEFCGTRFALNSKSKAGANQSKVTATHCECEDGAIAHLSLNVKQTIGFSFALSGHSINSKCHCLSSHCMSQSILDTGVPRAVIHKNTSKVEPDNTQIAWNGSQYISFMTSDILQIFLG